MLRAEWGQTTVLEFVGRYGDTVWGGTGTQYFVALATSERTYAVAAAQAAIDHDEQSDEFDDAIDQAKDVRKGGTANAGYSWSQAEHLARKVFTESTAVAEHQQSIDLAMFTYNFGNVVADETYDRDIRNATAERTYLNSETVARATRNTFAATVDATYWTAEQTARVGAQTLIDSQMQLPWTQYLVAATQMRLAWWNSAVPSYIQLANDRNSIESTYDAGVALDRQTRATTVSSAERIKAKAIALITRNEAVASADAIENYYAAVSPVSQVYVNRMAEIAKDAAIESGASTPPQNPTNWYLQRSSADSAFLSTAQTIQDSLKSALQTADFDASLSAIAADISLARAKVSIDNSYKSGEISRYVTKVTNRSAVEKFYAQFEASTLASTLANFATSNPTPWAQYDATDAASRNVWMIASTNSRAAFDTSAATHQAELETAIAATEANYFDALIVARGTPGPLNFALTLTPSLPIPSVAPSLSTFYATIAAGNFPASLGTEFQASGSSNYGSYGGGTIPSGVWRTGTNILNPQGYIYGGIYGYGGYGYNSYGGTGYSYGGGYAGGGSPTSTSSGVNWDLIAEADAIQSLESTNDLVDRYGIADIENLLASTSQSPSNGGGYGGGYGGGRKKGGRTPKSRTPKSDLNVVQANDGYFESTQDQSCTWKNCDHLKLGLDPGIRRYVD